MKARFALPRPALLVVALLTALPMFVFAGVPATAAAPPGCGVGGEAYGVSAFLQLLTPITVAKTGRVTLPPGGSQTGLAVNVPGVLVVGAPTTSTADTSSGSVASVQSSSVIGAVNILGGLVTASAVTTTANSQGDGSTASSTGGTVIAGLAVNGDPVLNLDPNTTINLLGGVLGNTVIGTVTINEQIRTGDGVATSGITANALHVRLLVGLLGLPIGTDIIVGSASSSVVCASGGGSGGLVPAITSLTPSVILVGSGDTIVTVDGTNFAPGATVLVNGTPVQTGFVNGGELTATLPAGMLGTPGTLQVTVQNPGGGVSAPAPLPIVAVAAGQFVTLTVETNGNGAVGLTPSGFPTGPTTFQFPLGTVVSIDATAGTGQTFIRWDFDGTFAGWADPADLTMDTNHTLTATFVQTPIFPDVPPGSAQYTAITELSARGIIRGYLNGTFGPDDGVQRAQMAALIARGTPAGPGTPLATLTPPACLVAGTWDCEDWGNNFTDRNGLDGNLWRNVGTLQHYGVALGYTAQDCADKGKTFPCFGPTDPVTYAQTISFVTRAMIAKGYWVAQPNANFPYTGVPAPHAADVATFTFYVGAIPAPPSNWNGEATRGWFAQALWAALDSYWGTDGTLPDDRAAGGFIP